MGKGDRRTRRGKIWRGTYGKFRPHKPKNKKPIPGALPQASNQE
ncbi:MAG: 30S ribosomal protein THX [Bacteroidia bacterium]|nr:30S ribosomal protein THX [Bacteroidia bacterium]MCX7652408.1 30S ribosomal protein THX [Bacteroidia bacterium]MDW8417359.1 30S ribosomal protein THX [Bacteroidia bacterium]